MNKFNKTDFKVINRKILWSTMQLNTNRPNPQAQIWKRNSPKSKSGRRRIRTQLQEPQIAAIESDRGQQFMMGLTNSQLGASNRRITPIVINTNQYPQRSNCITSYNHCRKASCLVRPQSTINQSRKLATSTQRKTQRQKFIDILQSKVLNSENNYNARCKTVEDVTGQPQASHRYHPIHLEQTQRMKASHIRTNSQIQKQYPVPHIEVEAINRAKNQSLDQSKLQEKRVVRNRSKTFAKQFITHSLGEPLAGEIVTEMSKTIEIDAFKITQKMKKSLHKIEKLNMVSPPPQRQTQETVFDNFYTIKDTQRQEIESNLNVSTIKNTEAYNQEIKHLTNDFFLEWQKMNVNKSQIYQQLRNKFVREFPEKRKHYTSYSLPEEEENKPNLKKKQSLDSYNLFNCDISSLKISQNYRSSNKSQSSYPSDSQIKGFQDKYELLKQKKLLREIFKQAWFWSRTKNKFMSSACPTIEEQAAVKELNNIKKKLTFMSYIKDKEGKGILKRKNKICGASIIRNKDIILELQKEGTREQTFLKKCLDDAIEDCIQENQ